MARWRLERLNGHFVLPRLDGADIFARSEGGKSVQIELTWEDVRQLYEDISNLLERGGGE